MFGSLRQRALTAADCTARFLRDRSAHVAVIYALMTPVLLGGAGFAVDYAGWSSQWRKLQGAADAAAVAAAREWYLANATDTQITSVATTIAKAQFANSKSPGPTLQVSASVNEEQGSVTVTLVQARKAFFTQALATRFSDLSAVAVARAAGGGRLCVVGLDERSDGTITLQDRAKMTAPECAVYSNATARSGIEISGDARIEAELVCSAGGADASPGSVTPDSPLTDCPQLGDPLAGRPAPDVGACDYDGSSILKQLLAGKVLSVLKNTLNSVVMKPGTYCNGLTIGDVSLVLMPGVYVITGGPLVINSNVALLGINVGFYLHGPDATLSFDAQTIVDLSAPVDGPLAGILFFEDREAPLDRVHSMRSQGAANLLGTVYLSRGILEIDTNAAVAKESAYTAIVARRLALRKEPDLFLNADYDATDVPVPSGIGPVGGNIVLER